MGETVRVTPASQMVLQRPIHFSRRASSAGLERSAEGNQRIVQALIGIVAPINNCRPIPWHRPRRTRPSSLKGSYRERQTYRWTYHILELSRHTCSV
jgi:hypothetical protein